jgi:alpha-ketoglutarate-dependent taurine dioxygenase
MNVTVNKLSEAGAAEISRQLGPLESQARTTYTHPDDPDILILSNEIRPDGTAVGIVDAGDFWHSDSSHHEEPCNRTVLYAVRNPNRGGATEFCNMYQVYDALPPDLKQRVEGATASNPRVTISAARTDAKDYYKQHEKVTKEVLQPSGDGSPGALHLAALHHQHCRHAGFRSAAFARQALRRHDGRAIPLPASLAGSGSGDLG